MVLALGWLGIGLSPVLWLGRTELCWVWTWVEVELGSGPDRIGPDRVGHGLAVMVLDLI